MKPCNPPVVLPDRDLTQREIVGFWSRDRSSLRQCETRRGAAVDVQVAP